MAADPTFDVDVTQTVRVALKPEAFTGDFMAEFRASFFQFYALSEHAEHIAQLVARGVMEEVYPGYSAGEFVEGYGDINQFVSVAAVIDTEHVVERLVPPFAAA